MRFTNIFTRTISRTSKQFLFAASSCVLLTISGCDDSSSDTDGSGYLKFYNASSNAPTIYAELDDESLTQVDFTKTSARYNLDSEPYDVNLSWKEGTNDYQEFYNQEVSITDEDVSLIVIAGDFNDPQILTYSYEDEDEELDDEDDEENFTFRVLDMYQDDNIDVYISADDQTFNEASLVGSYSYTELSDSQYYEVESYILYVTYQGSSEVLYQSDIIDFFYTNQYLVSVRANTGPSDSPFTIDLVGREASSVEYPDIDSKAEVRLYNGLIQHQLLADFENEIDFTINGVNQTESQVNLAKGEFSNVFTFASGDYAMDLYASGFEEPLATNHFVSLEPNQDKTVFVYLTEEREEDDDDADAEDQISIFVNTLAVENSHRVSLYDHQVNVINLVQDEEEEFTVLDVNFVRSNETVETAEYDITSSRANPRTITLPNNTYQISVIAEVNESELLLIFQELVLDADSGDLYMIIEEDDSTDTGYSAKFVPQYVSQE
ncbi:MAG: hypothetical protein KUG78_16100 [Kangiellaceae bacterium]|nr:hypothetical protein [Kangiellaceae bacterium]